MSELTALRKKLATLKQQEAKLLAQARKPKIAAIVRLMREFEISPSDVRDAFGNPVGESRPKREPKAAAKASKRPVPPKYRDPRTGATWSGRGMSPLWIREAEAAGTNRDTFLIEEGLATVTPAAPMNDGADSMQTSVPSSAAQ